MKKNKIVSVFVIGVLLLTAGCAKTPKIENGKEVFASIDGYNVTADDLYAELKSRGGLTVLLDMIDKNIIDKEITDQVGADSYADGQIETYRGYYGDQFEEMLKNYGYSSISVFRDYIKTEHLKEQVAIKYLKDTITEEELIQYYDANIFGDQTVRYILVRPAEVDSDAKDEEKLKAETEALEEATEIIKKIKNGEKFEDLAKEYSDDKLTGMNGGLMQAFNTDQVNKTFFNAAAALKDGEMTQEPIKDENGYNIILKVSSSERPALKEVRDSILEKIATNLLNAGENTLKETWVEIRSKYKLNITDTEVNTLYEANYK